MARDEFDIPMGAHTAGSAGGRAPSYRPSRVSAGMDPNTKRLVLIAGGIGGVLALLIGAYSIGGRHTGGVPVIEADSRPLRVKPLNPGGMDAGQDDGVLSGVASGPEQVAPPPEAPAPQALRQQEAAAKAAPPPATPAATTPTVAPSLAPLVGSTAVAAPSAPPAPTGPAPGSSFPVSPMQSTAQVSPPGPKSTAPASSAPAQPPQSGALVQLAALTSEAAATSEWQRLAHKMPDLLSQRRPYVSKIEHEGRTFFRLRTGGFTDVAQAKAFCAQVKEKGAGCSVASF